MTFSKPAKNLRPADGIRLPVFHDVIKVTLHDDDGEFIRVVVMVDDTDHLKFVGDARGRVLEFICRAKHAFHVYSACNEDMEHLDDLNEEEDENLMKCEICDQTDDVGTLPMTTAGAHVHAECHARQRALMQARKMPKLSREIVDIMHKDAVGD